MAHLCYSERTMSKTPNYDQKVKAILDDLTPGERTCSMTGEKWTMTEEEIGWYKKFNVPPSKVSPLTRWKHHGAWYVGYQYWYQRHPETRKPIICTVHPATGIKVLPDKEWFEKDFISAGRGYDPSRSFIEQWRDLQLAVPMPANRNHVEPVNSIAFVSQGDENSYFVGASKSRNSLYCHVAMDTEDSAEVYQGFSVTNSFNIVHSRRIFNCQYVRESLDCLNSAFLFDCRNCEFCFGATNKRNKKHLWFNEQLTETEWKRRRAEVDLASRKVLNEYAAKFQKLVEDAVWPENFNEQAENSTGEYLTKTTNVRDSYFCEEGAMNEYACNFSIGTSENCAFSGYPVFATDIYYSGSCSRGSQCAFCFLCIQSQHMEYSLLCYNCENCFGCVGLQRKRFCILNQQYREDDYWKKLDEIKCRMLADGEYGEFFPAKYSPSYWADSGAPVWFDTSEKDARAMGCLFFDPESAGAIGEDLSSATPTPIEEIPDRVDHLSDEWINRPLHDRASNRRFAMIKPEVEFYRRMNIAPPRKHFISRIKDLWLEANQASFMETKCEACHKPLRVAKNAAHPIRRHLCRSDYLKYLEANG